MSWIYDGRSTIRDFFQEYERSRCFASRDLWLPREVPESRVLLVLSVLLSTGRSMIDYSTLLGHVRLPEVQNCLDPSLLSIDCPFPSTCIT